MAVQKSKKLKKTIINKFNLGKGKLKSKKLKYKFYLKNIVI